MRSATMIFVLALAVSAGLPSVASAVDAKPKAGAAATAADPKPKAGVVATVNGADIGTDDFSREMNRVERLFLSTGKPLTCTEIGRIRAEVIEGMVRRELLYQEGKKKVRVSEEEVAAEVKKLKQKYQSDADFTNALAKMKLSPTSLNAQVERTLTVQKIVEMEFASKAAVTDKEIWSYYDRNRDSFRQPEQVRASHILVKVEPQADAGKKAAARKKIDDILAKVRQGQDFASLARTYSEDPSGAKGGDLGYVRPGQLVKPFEEALFSLKPGEVSDVVETGLGYHVIKAVERKPETTIPFESLKDQLRTLLKQEKGQQEANAYIGKVREKAKVEIFPQAGE